MTKVMMFAAERKLLDRIAGELLDARATSNHAALVEAVEDLEVIVMFTDFPTLRARASELIKTAYEPMPDPWGLRS
ncbi:hypothetical protein [Aureimonas phyllosphaerae]|uniref:Uncharacterized protein n=1 Tax=Aureimonas phyllosphaerae TaxID=1166078 RepID=A0A7W6FSS8_9HYPH|nr:hypothetical protein [Aureimonas phyllosphaerae]MBB3934278.1 hypothetical protein [Aureimonas phyllosphaerae]MBB3958506.1 hypothetical protein [Aureimonas phyllosphaerae]SFE98104.1 hypothetical protein SAMN05216566_101482 [Aureimonas phyllosphaerae]